MKIHLKKILVSLLVIIGFVFYAIYQRYFNEQQNLVTNPSLDKSAAQTASGTSGTASNQTENKSASQAEIQPPTGSTEILAGGNGDDEYGDDDEEDGAFTSQQTTTSPSNQTNNSSSASATSSSSSSATGTTSGSSSSTTTTMAAGNIIYKDGQYDGSAESAYYGLVQVRAIVQSGRLTDVVFLSYPNDRSYSIQLNTDAMPILKAEAIKAQSAKVDIVTGATNTSRAFINSLSNALSQAQV
ncbi:MAG: FMN-binding protein [Actinobacteria bacterium]|nr:FMN-binding protein [Actinomycetota bacterium]